MERRFISEEEIEAKRTANGGFTKKVLKIWGVPWPPPPGWKKRLLKYGYYDVNDVAEDGHPELERECDDARDRDRTGDKQWRTKKGGKEK